MPGAQRKPSAERVALGSVRLLGGEVITCDASDQAATLPSETSIVMIDARGGDVYYSINNPIASVAPGPGYVPMNGGRILGPLTEPFNQFTVYGLVGAFAHLQYFREVG